jgi:hypothetical protein
VTVFARAGPGETNVAANWNNVFRNILQKYWRHRGWRFGPFRGTIKRTLRVKLRKVELLKLLKWILTDYDFWLGNGMVSTAKNRNKSRSGSHFARQRLASSCFRSKEY